MNLSVGQHLLPLLLLCSNCLAAVNKNSKFYDHDGTKQGLSLVEARGNKSKDNVEVSEDDPQAEFPCPVASAIEPCVCSAEPDDNRLYLDCTLVESEEQLAAVFQQEFPVKLFYQFSMSNNSAVKMLHSFMNGITFDSLFLFPGPFDLETVSEYFLLDLKDTVKDITIRDSKLITEMFPFLMLPLLTELTSLSFIDSDMDWIPPIRAPSLSHFGVSSSPVELLKNGTIAIGPGTMTVNLYNNTISSMEPGSIYFADEESAASSEMLSIELVGNRLQSLQAGTFLLRNGIYRLYMYDNQIVSIEPGTFVLPDASGPASYGELYIDLAPNQLQSLQAGTFPLRNGEVTLYLYSNNISSIEPGTFVLPEDTDSLILHLDLGSNELTTIDEAVFGDLMPFIPTLGLYDNPLTCGCDIVWLIMNTTYMGKVDSDTRCADGLLLHDLIPEDFVDWCLV